MDDMKELLNGGPLAVLGAVLTMAGGGILAFRKFFRSDQVQGAAAGAQLDVIEQLRSLLKEANERADIERKRADEAFAAKNEALAAVADLKAQVTLLQGQVATLTKVVQSGNNA